MSPPVKWPVYPHSGVHEALDRHIDGAAHITGRLGAPGRYGLAVDVWRDGEHVWRSYDVATSESVWDWFDRELPAGTAPNHDEGWWSMAGIHGIDLWPIPTAASLHTGMTVQEALDVVVTCLALAQLPAAPEGLDSAPTPEAVYTRLSRKDTDGIVVKLVAAGVAVRAYLVRVDISEDTAPELPHRSYTARMEPRGDDTNEPVKQVQITAAAKPNRIIREAKAALGVPGWPAQRRDDSLTWYLTNKPYRVVVEPD